MNNRAIAELFKLVESCQNNLHKKHQHCFDNIVEASCYSFCVKNNIHITHGSAFNELRHKTYYYLDKNIKDIINKGKDTYQLRANNIMSDKKLVDILISRGGRDGVI